MVFRTLLDYVSHIETGLWIENITSKSQYLKTIGSFKRMADDYILFKAVLNIIFKFWCANQMNLICCVQYLMICTGEETL